VVRPRGRCAGPPQPVPFVIFSSGRTRCDHADRRRMRVLSPMLGLAASAVVIGICALLFWLALKCWSWVRCFAWDVLFFRKEVPGNAVACFSPSARFKGCRGLTLGRLTRDPNGILEFRYRARRIRLEDASAYEVGRGMPLSHGCLAEQFTFRLLPRYRGSEEAVRAALGLAGVKEIRARKTCSRSLVRMRGPHATHHPGDRSYGAVFSITKAEDRRPACM